MHRRVDPVPIYVRDGDVTTAAGVTSALDLAMAFVEEDNGAALARQVARGLVTYLQRPGNQAQMSMFVTAPGGSSAISGRHRPVTCARHVPRRRHPVALPGHPHDRGPSTDHRQDDEPDAQRHVQQHAELRQ